MDCSKWSLHEADDKYFSFLLHDLTYRMNLILEGVFVCSVVDIVNYECSLQAGKYECNENMNTKM